MCQNNKGLIIIWSSISVLAVCVLIANLNIHFLTIAKTENCPSCYGKSMCHCFIGDKFHFNWDHLWSNLLNLFFSGKFYFGSCDGELVVVKKFTKPERYQDMELPLLIKDENTTILKIVNKVGQLLSKSRSTCLEQCINKFHFCPTFEKLGLFFELSAVNTHFKDLNQIELYLSFLHMVQVNVEPLIQQVRNPFEYFYKLLNSQAYQVRHSFTNLANFSITLKV